MELRLGLGLGSGLGSGLGLEEPCETAREERGPLALLRVTVEAPAAREQHSDELEGGRADELAW